MGNNPGMFNGSDVMLKPNNVKEATTVPPSAGAECLTIVPTGFCWRLLSWYNILTTDTDTAARNFSLYIADASGNVLIRPTSTGTFALASSSVGLQAVSGLGVTYAGITGLVVAGMALPDPTYFILPNGYQIGTITGNKHSGDQWGVTRMLVDEIPIRF